jgi:hypothetical protein
MKKFLFHALPFLVIVTLVGYIRFQFLAGDLADKRTFYKQLPDTKFSNAWLIVGDSKSQFGFDDNLMLDSIISNFSNLSIWGARPLDYLQNLKNHPIENSVIFIVISSRTFLEPDTMYKFHRTFDIRELFDFNLYSSAHDYLLGNSGKMNQGAWEYSLQPAGSLRYKYNKRIGSAYNRHDDSIHQLMNIQLYPENEFLDIKIKHLKQLIQQLSKRSNRVLLISLPERQCYKQWLNTYDLVLFQRIEEKTGLSVIDFGAYNDAFFYDSHHLNGEGSRYFTTQFLERFKHLKGPSNLFFPQ